MNFEERYEALASASPDKLEDLADRILACGPKVRVINGPETASAPVRYPVPAHNATTVLGHVALSTCTVELSGVRGDGIRPGRDLTGAVAAAVCDAEAERDGPLTADVLALCRTSVKDRADSAQGRADLVAMTRLGS